MRRAAKVDRNQAAIVLALRGVGATVCITSDVGRGYPDLTVGFRGCTFLVEVKMPGEGLTPDQVAWHQMWNGHVAIVHSEDEAYEAIGAI